MNQNINIEIYIEQRELVKLVQDKKSKKALLKLVDQYQGLIKSHAYSLYQKYSNHSLGFADVEQIVTKEFIACVKSYDFNSTKHFGAYVKEFSFFGAANELRRIFGQKRTINTSGTLSFIDNGDNESAEKFLIESEKALAKEQLLKIRRTLDGHRYTQKETRVLKMLIDGFSLEEIANFLGLSVNNARSAIQRGIKKIHKKDSIYK